MVWLQLRQRRVGIRWLVVVVVVVVVGRRHIKHGSHRRRRGSVRRHVNLLGLMMLMRVVLNRYRCVLLLLRGQLVWCVVVENRRRVVLLLLLLLLLLLVLGVVMERLLQPLMLRGRLVSVRLMESAELDATRRVHTGVRCVRCGHNAQNATFAARGSGRKRAGCGLVLSKKKHRALLEFTSDM